MVVSIMEKLKKNKGKRKYGKYGELGVLSCYIILSSFPLPVVVSPVKVAFEQRLKARKNQRKLKSL